MEPLRQQLAGAKCRGEPFPSTLLAGPSGIGKTLLAKSLAAEYGTEVILAHGRDSPADIAAKFRSAKANDFVFTDESHGLVVKAQELLLSVIDDRTVPNFADVDEATDGERPGTTVKIEPCTVVLATDQPGKLRNALLKRLELKVSLDFYPNREMREIVDLIASELNMLLSPHAANQIAKISGGLPRLARLHLLKLRRHFPHAEDRQISVEDVRQYRACFGIDANGLELEDCRYLRYLCDTAKASLQSLAFHLGVDLAYVEAQIEPKLRRLRFISVGSGGRTLTSLGHEWIAAHPEQPDLEDEENGDN